MHEQVVRVLKAQFPDTVKAHPERMAQHYSASMRPERALPYWQQAGQQAIACSANHEAVYYLQMAHELIQNLPDCDKRRQNELEILVLLGSLTMALEGHGTHKARQVYERARYLCEQSGNIPQLFNALWGLWRVYLNQPALVKALELGERLCGLANQLEDNGLRIQAHCALGATLHYTGTFAEAKANGEIALSLYQASRHRTLSQKYGGQDPAVHCLAIMAATSCS